MAQEQPVENQLEEVTVSAQRREQNLQDVGISVVALSGEALRNSGVSDNIDAVVKIPNVANESPYGPGTSANIVMRGVGLNDFGEGHEAPVTAYVDEFYLLAVPSVQFSIYDLQRLEVLRGPQGTLFGRNATAGMIQYITARPTQEWSGFAQLAAGSFGERKFEGAVGGPVTDGLSFRVSALSVDSDGYVKNGNPAFGPGGQAGTKAIRGQLQYQSDDWRINYKGEYGELDARQVYYGSIPGQFLATGLLENDPQGTDLGGYDQQTFRNGIVAGPNRAFTDFPSHQRTHSATHLLRIERDVGDVTFTSLTGYSSMARDLQEDCDASPNPFCQAYFPYSTHYYTQELRLGNSSGATRWTTGVYWLDATGKNRPHSNFLVPVESPAPVDPATGLYDGAAFPIALAADWTLRTQSASVFGQIEHDLGERWTAIAGLRVTRDDKDFLDRDNSVLRQCNDPSYAGGYCATDYTAMPYHGTYEQTLYSGRLELQWRPMDRVMLYGSVSRGTKAGGFNNGFISVNASNLDKIPYGDETNIATELGFKSTLLDGRLRLNASLFNYDYKDYQAYNWFNFGGLVVNRDAVSRGGEVEIVALLSSRLEATLNLGGLDTRVDDITLPDTVTTVDRQMASAPHFTGGAALKYTVPLGATGNLALSWGGNYAGSSFTNLANDPAARVDSYFLHNARLSYAFDEHWEFAVAMNNVSDKEVPTRPFVFAALGFSQQLYSRPRTTLAQVTYQW